jgi:thioredoxin 1
MHRGINHCMSLRSFFCYSVFVIWGKGGTMAGSLCEFTDANFSTDVLEAEGLVVVDFWAPWCGPCIKLTPTIEQLAAESEGVSVGKLNTDENMQTASSLGISSIPTVILFKNGQVVDRKIGMNPIDVYKDMIKLHS